MQHFKDQLTELIKRFNGDRQKAADSLRVTRPYISQLLNGTRKPSDAQVRLLELTLAIKDSATGSNVRIAPPERGLRFVPVIASMRAGILDSIAANYEDIANQIDERIETSCQDENAFALIVEGDSMEHRYQAGDRIIVAPNWEPRPGDPVVARFAKDGKTLFKIYRPIPPRGERVRLESLNTNYETQEFAREDFRFIYPAVDLKAKLRR